MLELKGNDAAIMVIPSDGSRGNSPRISQRYLCAASFTLRHRADCNAEQGKTHVLLQSPSLISSKKTDTFLPFAF